MVMSTRLFEYWTSVAWVTILLVATIIAWIVYAILKWFDEEYASWKYSNSGALTGCLLIAVAISIVFIIVVYLQMWDIYTKAGT